MKEEIVNTKKNSNYSQESPCFSLVFFFFVNSLNDWIKKYVKLCNDWLECVYVWLWVSEQADRYVPFLPQDEVKIEDGNCFIIIFFYYLYPTTYGTIEKDGEREREKKTKKTNVALLLKVILVFFLPTIQLSDNDFILMGGD